MRQKTIIFGVMTLTLAAGCGSSGGGSNASESVGDSQNSPSDDETDSGTRSISKVGMVGVIEGSTGFTRNAVIATGDFSEYEEQFEVAVPAENPFANTIGKCTVEPIPEFGGFGQIPKLEPEEEVKSIDIDAGPGLGITSDGEEYLSLNRISIDTDVIQYGSIEEIPPMAPNLKLNIPGAQFPSFTDIPITTVGPVGLTTTGGEELIRFDTSFSWPSGNNSDVIILISTSSETTLVDCIVPDTGSFEFPQETQNEMGTGFFGDKLLTARVAYNIYFKDDSALVVYSMNEN